MTDNKMKSAEILSTEVAIRDLRDVVDHFGRCHRALFVEVAALARLFAHVSCDQQSLVRVASLHVRTVM